MRIALVSLAFVALGCSSSSPSNDADGGATSDAATSDAKTKTDAKSTSDAAAPDDDASSGACSTQNDCPQPYDQVCDPNSATCTAAECGETSGKSCDASDICVYESEGSTIGACYAKCTPFAPNACPSGQECVIGSFDGVQGFCMTQGTIAKGATCTGSNVTTQCVAGSVCIPDPTQQFCREQCDFWGAQHACSDALLCTPPGVCTGDVTDPAATGTPCAKTSVAGTLCGPSNGKLLGWCIGNTGSAQCDAWCRMQGNDCTGNQTCQPTNVPSIGYCQ
jgi:hypothetical protein